MTSKQKVSRFRDEAARRRFLEAYDRALAAWPSPPDEHEVVTPYGSTQVHSWGAGSATPIVLLHAVAVASPSWYPSSAALGDDHRIHAIDTITDAGHSVPTREVRDAADMARWLDLTLAEMELDRVHLVGLSYGGWLALSQARRAPDRLESVVSIDPPGAFGKLRLGPALSMVPDAVLAKVARSDRALDRLLRRLNNGAPLDPPLQDLMVEGLRTFRLVQPPPRRMADDDLRAIRVPTLLLFGERSPVNDPERAVETAQRALDDCVAEVVPEVGHMLPVERPAEFAARVLRFITGIEARRG